MDILIASMLVVVALANFLLGLIVLKNNSKRLENKLFAVFLFAAIFWAIGDALMLYSDSMDIARLGLILFYVSPLITTLFVVLFSFAFPDRDRINPWVVFILSLPAALFFIALSIHPEFALQSIVINPGAQNEVVHSKVPYTIYSLYFNIYFIIAYIRLLLSLKGSEGENRKKLLYAFWSIFIASFAALFTNLTLPIMGNSGYVYAGPLFLLIFSGVIFLGIVKHRLFDIRFVVVRALGYIFSTIALAIIYGFFTFSVVSTLVFNDSNISSWQKAVYTLLAVIIAFTFQPLKRFFDKWTNKLFYQDAYDPQRLIHDLNKVLVSTIDLNNMLSVSAGVLSENIKPEFCAFGLRETDTKKQRIIGDVPTKFSAQDVRLVREITSTMKTKVVVAERLGDEYKSLRSKMRKNNVAVLVRLTTDIGSEGVGYIILGLKKSGNIYNSQDIQVLETAANSLVIAIDNALRFEEIQNFNINLKNEVAQATNRLQRANDKLVALDQTKDDFISMASHQLRTPLTSVKGYISMVLEGDAGEITKDQKNLLEQAFFSSQRMVYLISDLLNVSRLRTGKFVIEPTPINLAEIIESEVAQLKETAAARGLKLIYSKPKNFPTLMIDETKIRQVLTNFMDNAIYYTPSGGRIEVNLENGRQSIELTVVDNGIGVPKHEQHNLFTKFFRAGNAKKARPDGTGLGLFMAKKVVIAQGGAIIFKSSEGKGSTFGFSLNKSRLQQTK